MEKPLSSDEVETLLATLKSRFDRHKSRHEKITWKQVEQKLAEQEMHFRTLLEMERTGGEPDIITMENAGNQIIFADCSAESPKGHRSLCYDREALDTRKENKPAGNAVDMAAEMGVELMSEEQYRALQKLGHFDQKTSSWIKTPDAIRKLGGALFCDYRYDTVFVYHNGAQSYYGSRGFRGLLKL